MRLPPPKQWVANILNKGTVGEQAGRNVIQRELGEAVGDRVNYRIGEKMRISDDTTSTGLIEVKNVKQLSMSQQLRDAVEFSQNGRYGQGGVLHLVVRDNTTLTGPVAEAVESGSIKLYRMTGSDLDAAAQQVIDSKVLKFFV